MRILLTLLFTLLVGYLPAQSRLGYNMGQIRADFPKETWEYGYTNGNQWMAFNDGNIYAVYWFDSDGYCFITTVTPLTTGKLNYYVELYNSQFVIIDNFNWKWYSPEGIVVYVALRKYDNTAIFLFTRKSLN